jgi:carbon starvation protein
MLMEGLVGVVALIAAAALPNGIYYDINIDLARRPEYERAVRLIEAAHVPHDGHDAAAEGGSGLAEMEQAVGESLHGRTGGAVTLAVGMAQIFSKALPSMDRWISYWYHFAIMFEALFILTTIDTGTRIGRFLVQEFLGRLWKPLGNLDWLPGSIVSTALVVAGWAYLISSNSVDTIWPMFGLANQLLALIALVLVATVLFNTGRGRYAAVVLLPACWVAATTGTTAYLEVTGKYAGWIRSGDPALVFKGYLNSGLTLFLLACVALILTSAIRRWLVAGRRVGSDLDVS